MSSTVKDLVAGSGLVLEDAGEQELKGVPDRWRLYRVASLPFHSTASPKLHDEERHRDPRRGDGPVGR